MTENKSYKKCEGRLGSLPPPAREVNLRWTEDGWYVVDVAFNHLNPIFRTLMRVSCRGSVAVIPSTSVEDPACPIRGLHYLHIVRAVDLGGAS